MKFENPNVPHATACLEKTMVVQVGCQNADDRNLSVVFIYGDYGSTPDPSLLTPERVEKWVSNWKSSDIVTQAAHDHSPYGDYALWYSFVSGLPLNIGIVTHSDRVTSSHMWCDWLPEHRDMQGYPAIDLKYMRFIETVEDVAVLCRELRVSDPSSCAGASNPTRKFAQLSNALGIRSTSAAHGWSYNFKAIVDSTYDTSVSFQWDFSGVDQMASVLEHYDPHLCEHSEVVRILNSDYLSEDDVVGASFLASVVDAGGKWCINEDGWLMCAANAYVIAKAVG